MKLSATAPAAFCAAGTTTALFGIGVAIVMTVNRRPILTTWSELHAGLHYMGHRNITHTVRYTVLSRERFKGLWKLSNYVVLLVSRERGEVLGPFQQRLSLLQHVVMPIIMALLDTTEPVRLQLCAHIAADL